MTSVVANDGSEDVNDFLRRIQKMRDDEIREDTERSRRLEEDILEKRRQREGRAAERARSLSPDKSSPTRTPPPALSSRSISKPDFAPSTPLSSASKFAQPRPGESPEETMKIAPGVQLSDSPSKAGNAFPEPLLTTKSLPGAGTAPSRSGTLSWQQRPATVRGPRSRPMSMVDSRPPSASSSLSTNLSQTADDATVSRAQISQNLAAKDPTWFRQTADRGVGSPAYRKTMGDASTSGSTNVDRRALHGLSREATPDATRDQSLVSSVSSKKLDESFSSDAFEPERRAVNTSFEGGSDTRLALRPTPPLNQKPVDVDLATSPVRAKFERPESPTKGMGGFVQSAMLKRSESITKRWSAQPSAGLSRHNSNSSARGGAALPSPISMPRLGEKSRESSHDPDSRPGSRQGEGSVDRHDFISRQDGRQHQRSQSTLSLRDRSPIKTSDLQSPPSPPKRWSPVKSTWLESALSKPESPATKPTTPLNQPSWMTQLSKAKAARASRDENKIEAAESPSCVRPLVRPKPPIVEPTQEQDNVEGEALLTPQANERQEHEPQLQAKTETTRSTNDIAKADPVAFENLIPLQKGKGEQLAVKTKPQTPPKKDFRLNLKSRPTPTEPSDNQELEFRNAFGKLKRTQTKNYVAPDELKNNILRGKSELSLTDGPKKTPRRDELKEDLLKQKEAMKAKAAVTPSQPPPIRKTSESVVPEAIAKKKALGQTTSSGNGMTRTAGLDKSGQRETPTRSQRASSDADKAIPSSALSDLSDASVAKKSSEASVSTSMLAAKPSSSKLADRFNPSLAAIFAKGPAQAPSGIASTREAPLTHASRSTGNPGDQPAGQLQHMTKARARGPKRRVPKAGASAVVLKPETEDARVVKPDTSSGPTIPSRSRNINPTWSSLHNNHAATLDFTTKSETPLKSPALKKDSTLLGEVVAPGIQTTDSPRTPLPPSEPSKPSSVRALDSGLANTRGAKPLKTMISNGSIASDVPEPISVKNASAMWGQKPDEAEPKVKPPVEIPKRQKEESPALDGHTSHPTSATASIQLSSATALQSSKSPSLPQSQPKITPPKPRTKLEVTVPKNATPSPNTRASDARKLFSEHFDESPVAPKELEIDTDTILHANQNRIAKIKTLRKSISELAGNGKATPVPSNQEHILYNDRMYVCTHVFGGESGARQTEVYLWLGSSVAESTSDDAQLFVKKIAKDNSGKLFTFRQGKESANFLQALGGIVISRSSSSRNGSASYMLCGRQHLGHLAFDEIPCDVQRLCSGFPFIVAAGPDKMFLWKGHGCNDEEVAGARLISMDVSPSAGVVEIDEGSETPDFLAVFSKDSRNVPASAGHWKQKPQHDNYRTRLFHVEWHERPTSRHNTGPATALWGMVRRQSQAPPTHLTITELSPFVQDDLYLENVYVLDAFFEIYIILQPLTRRKALSFANALVFAQEYSIMSASADARPFVPPCTVIVEGAPRDMKACFRHWDDEVVDTSRLMAGRPKAKQRLRVLGLGEALAACRA